MAVAPLGRRVRIAEDGSCGAALPRGDSLLETHLSTNQSDKRRASSCTAATCPPSYRNKSVPKMSLLGSAPQTVLNFLYCQGRGTTPSPQYPAPLATLASAHHQWDKGCRGGRARQSRPGPDSGSLRRSPCVEAGSHGRAGIPLTWRWGRLFPVGAAAQLHSCPFCPCSLRGPTGSRS